MPGIFDRAKNKLKTLVSPAPEPVYTPDPSRLTDQPAEMMTDYGAIAFGPGDEVKVQGQDRALDWDTLEAHGESGAYAIADGRHRPLPIGREGSVLVPNGVSGSVRAVGESTVMVLFPEPYGLLHMNKKDVHNVSGTGGRKRWGGKDDPASQFLLEEIGQVGDLMFYYVDGTAIQDSNLPGDSIDFVFGGTHCAYPELIPEGQGWIDVRLKDKPIDAAATMVHESIENGRMTEHGESYNEAHTVADRYELEFRLSYRDAEIRDVHAAVLEYLSAKTDAPMPPRAAASIIDLRGVADAYVAEATPVLVQALRGLQPEATWQEARKAAGEIASALPQPTSVLDLGFRQGKGDLLSNSNADRLFSKTRIGWYLYMSPNLGEFDPRWNTIGLNVSTILLELAAEWGGDEKRVQLALTQTLEHELRHAADWAYQEAARPGKFVEEVQQTQKDAPGEYYNLPTEMRSFAGDAARAVWQKYGPQWRRFSGKQLFEAIAHHGQSSLEGLKEENKPRFLQMVVKSLEQLEMQRLSRLTVVKTADFGGPGPFTLPDEHQGGMIVPEGGSSCASCRYVSDDLKHCSNKHWQAWSGTDELPAPADEYCSDWYEPKTTKVSAFDLEAAGERWSWQKYNQEMQRLIPMINDWVDHRATEQQHQQYSDLKYNFDSWDRKKTEREKRAPFIEFVRQHIDPNAFPGAFDKPVKPPKEIDPIAPLTEQEVLHLLRDGPQLPQRRQEWMETTPMEGPSEETVKDLTKFMATVAQAMVPLAEYAQTRKEQIKSKGWNNISDYFRQVLMHAVSDSPHAIDSIKHTFDFADRNPTWAKFADALSKAGGALTIAKLVEKARKETFFDLYITRSKRDGLIYNIATSMEKARDLAMPVDPSEPFETIRARISKAHATRAIGRPTSLGNNFQDLINKDLGELDQPQQVDLQTLMGRILVDSESESETEWSPERSMNFREEAPGYDPDAPVEMREVPKPQDIYEREMEEHQKAWEEWVKTHDKPWEDAPGKPKKPSEYMNAPATQFDEPQLQMRDKSLEDVTREQHEYQQDVEEWKQHLRDKGVADETISHWLKEELEPPPSVAPPFAYPQEPSPREQHLPKEELDKFWTPNASLTRVTAHDMAPDAILTWKGLEIAIEARGGEVRWPNAKHPQYVPPSWVGMGYFVGLTEPDDGDSLDVIIGPEPAEERPVFLAIQIDADDGHFRQWKVFLGFNNSIEVEGAFRIIWRREMFGGVWTVPSKMFRKFVLPRIVDPDEMKVKLADKRIAMRIVAIDPAKITPPHDVKNLGKADKLTRAMAESGWNGRPILAYLSGGQLQALTGSHRIAAARAAKLMSVPVLLIEDADFVNDEIYSQLDDAEDNYSRLAALESLLKANPIAKAAYDLMMEELIEKHKVKRMTRSSAFESTRVVVAQLDDSAAAIPAEEKPRPSYDPEMLTRHVKTVLTPELLKKKYIEKIQMGAHPLTGHCYAASEALYHMLGGPGSGYTPVNIKHEGESHWYLRGPDGKIYDPTSEQFASPVPYDKGRGKGFLTYEPSARARKIIDRLKKRIGAITEVSSGITRVAMPPAADMPDLMPDERMMSPSQMTPSEIPPSPSHRPALTPKEEDQAKKDRRERDRRQRGEPDPTKVSLDEMGLKHHGGVENIKAVLAKATPEEIDYWGRWYRHSHDQVKAIADRTGTPFDVVAAMVAALSPGLKWEMNLDAAEAIILGVDKPGGVGKVPGAPSRGGWSASREKAKRILQTGDTSYAAGPKVRVFYESIVNPVKTAKDIVLDGHAINIWRGFKRPLKNIPITDKEKVQMRADYQKVGEETGLGGQAVQAITWSIWRAASGTGAKDASITIVADEEGGLDLEHYSTTPDLTEIDPSYIGSGKLSRPEQEDTSVPVSFYYTKGTEHETLLKSTAHALYEGKLSPEQSGKIYDIGEDPDGLVKATYRDGRGAMYGAIKSAGYFGMKNSRSSLPDAVMLFYKIPVKQVKNLRASAAHLAYPWGEDDGITVIAADVVHPHTSVPEPPVKPVNEQAVQHGQHAGDIYRDIAKDFGTLTPGSQPNLRHYDYRPYEQGIDDLIGQSGYQVYYAGGKYGKPDLANKNYNTGHLMVYDPTPGFGGDFGDEAYTRSWRKIHELSHGLSYGDLNAKYGEGRRIGKLGTHRTLREAKRAVEWEWLAAHKQRELSEKVGHPIDDATFARELNTVMHDAVHRAITGKFTNPDEEGFAPSDRIVPLEVSLGKLEQAARQMGLQGEDDLLAKRSAATITTIDEVGNDKPIRLNEIKDGDVARLPDGTSGKVTKVLLDAPAVEVRTIVYDNEGAREKKTKLHPEELELVVDSRDPRVAT